MITPTPRTTLFPYTTLFRSLIRTKGSGRDREPARLGASGTLQKNRLPRAVAPRRRTATSMGLLLRSEEHTSELQSHHDLVCRLLLEKKKNMIHYTIHIQRKN